MRYHSSRILRSVLVAIVATLARVKGNREATDKQWMSWVTTRQYPSVNASTKLSERADDLLRSVTNIPDSSRVGDVDIVVSGGGNLDGFFLGVQMILDRANRTFPGAIDAQRFAGASAGGMMPFELLLRGESEILQEHIAYGMMSTLFPSDYSNALYASSLQDHHWRLMSEWMCQTYNTTLGPTLNDRMFLALSCLDPLPKQVIVSQFTSVKQTQSAFMGTGTVFEWYDGMPCSDGGAMSGKEMTPLFRDARRPQIIVNLMRTGFPESLVFKYNASEAEALVRHGQDVALAMLQCGLSDASCGTEALSYCDTGKATSSQVCGS